MTCRTSKIAAAAGAGMLVAASLGLSASAQAPARGASPQLPPLGTTKGQQYSRLVIRNAMLISGRGTPAEGPVDIVVEKDRIADIIPLDGVSMASYGPGFKRPDGDRVIDATGMYVMPGIVDMHAHIPGNGQLGTGPQGKDYSYRLWLGNGITTLRDPGARAGLDVLTKDRELSARNEIVAPRLVIYKFWVGTARETGHGHTPEEARILVRQFHDQGADGVKAITEPSHYPDVLEAICDEAKKLGMGVAVDLKVSETDAVEASNAGVTSIEHWYGIPDAAIPGSQDFPGDYNYSNERQRFREAANLWPEAEQHPERILQVLDLMIKNHTVWDPTMVVYEPNRDLTRALNLPWRGPFALPSMIEYWEPNPTHHASFHYNWRTSDEVAWKRNYDIWMKYVKAFFDRGGRLTVGSDAGTQQALYGFSTLRELELMQEAGLHPIDIVKIATVNATETLGLKDLAGIRIGQIADIDVVDGNPLDNFKVLYGLGHDDYTPDGKKTHHVGVRWTIKGGVVFDAPALLREAEWYVREAKAGRLTTSQQ
jgi:imidazolonepropionase-like amidohydrolase